MNVKIVAIFSTELNPQDYLEEWQEEQEVEEGDDAPIPSDDELARFALAQFQEDLRSGDTEVESEPDFLIVAEE